MHSVGVERQDTQLQLGRDTEELLSPGMVKNTRLRCIMQTLEKGEWFPDSWSELPSGETRFPSVSKFTSKRFFRKELFPSFVLYTLSHMWHFRRLDFIQSWPSEGLWTPEKTFNYCCFLCKHIWFFSKQLSGQIYVQKLEMKMIPKHLFRALCPGMFTTHRLIQWIPLHYPKGTVREITTVHPPWFFSLPWVLGGKHFPLPLWLGGVQWLV